MNGNLEQWIKEINNTLSNHITEVAADIATIQANLGWLKWILGIMMVALIGGSIKLWFP